MKAAVYIDSSRIEMRETNDPKIGPADLLLRVHACGVCGTDIRKIRHGLAKPQTVLGHEVAGEVARIGNNVRKFALGDRIVVAHHTPCYVCHYCRHGNYSMCKTFKTSNLDPGGFAELVRIPASHVEMTAFRIPDGMSYERAIHMEPLGCVIRNLKRTNLQPGDTVLVIGLGSIGLLTGQMVRRIPCRVIATDLREDRRSIARILGFEKVLHGNDPNLGTEIRQATDGRGADLVVLTAGTPALYEEAAHWVREGGSVNIFAGLEPGARVSYDLEELYHREITIFSSYSASPQDLGEALQHLAAGTVNVEIFSSEPFGLKNVSEAVQAVVEQRILKAIIRPEGISL